MNKWFKISGGVAAVAVAGLLTIGGVAYAQDAPKGGYAQGEQNGPSGFMQRGNRGGGEGRFGGDHGGRHGGPEFMDQDAMKAVVAQTLGLSVADLDAAKEAGKHLPQLAEEQGVDMETVKAAMKAEATRQVNQAVADGTITQAQADRILRRIENGRGPGHGPGCGGRHGDRQGGPEFMDQDAMKAVVAQTLGLSVADLDAAKEAGKHLPQLAEEQGVDMETVKAAMKAEATRQVNQAVADGTITQAQADRILRRIENGPGPGHGPGRNRPKLDETPGASEGSDSVNTSANSSWVETPTVDSGAIFLPVVLTY